MTLGLGALMTLAALGLAMLVSVDLSPLLDFRWRSFLIGVAATAPLILMLVWFMRSALLSIVRFRASQIEFFRNVGFTLTPMRIVLLSLAAGVGEELLFRGVLQTAADRYWPTAGAIAAPSILFGLLHARTALYAVAAGVVGAYLGALFWLTGGLTAPIVTHALYDFIAFEWTRRILAANPV